MSVARVYALLGIPAISKGNRKAFSDEQLIFPGIRFNCSGEVVRWIMGGTWRNVQSRNSQYPELQIWRLTGDTTYSKEQSTTVIATSEEDDRVYEFPVVPPLQFQPGDILGVRQHQVTVDCK